MGKTILDIFISSWGIKIRHPLELYIEMGKNILDIFISSWGIKIRHPLELYIEMGKNILDIFISSWFGTPYRVWNSLPYKTLDIKIPENPLVSAGGLVGRVDLQVGGLIQCRMRIELIEPACGMWASTAKYAKWMFTLRPCWVRMLRSIIIHR